MNNLLRLKSDLYNKHCCTLISPQAHPQTASGTGHQPCSRVESFCGVGNQDAEWEKNNNTDQPNQQKQTKQKQTIVTTWRAHQRCGYKLARARRFPFQRSSPSPPQNPERGHDAKKKKREKRRTRKGGTKGATGFTSCLTFY